MHPMKKTPQVYDAINNSVDNNTAAPITQTSSYANPNGSYGAPSSVTAKNTVFLKFTLCRKFNEDRTVYHHHNSTS